MPETKSKERRQYEKTIVDQLLRKRGWKLTPNLAYITKKVLTAIENSAQETQDAEAAKRAIEREATRQYSAILHAASRLDGTRKQHQAFEELWAYLFPIALYKTKDEEQAKDYTQRALVKIWRKSDQCTDPGRFLGWCKVVLLNEVRMGFRAQTKEADIVSIEVEQEESGHHWNQATQPVPGNGRSLRLIEEHMIEDERIQYLKTALKAALHSEAQYTVIEELYMKGWEFSAIADELNTTPSNVYTLKSRALTRLRQDEGFRCVLEEFLDRAHPEPVVGREE